MTTDLFCTTTLVMDVHPPRAEAPERPETETLVRRGKKWFCSAGYKKL